MTRRTRYQAGQSAPGRLRRSEALQNGVALHARPRQSITLQSSMALQTELSAP